MVSKKSSFMNVSVCMATHNGEKYLRQQIDSILTQLGEGDELIVSDDNSVDETNVILKSLNDPRVRILGSMKFGTPSKNFEYTLRQCKHPIIFLSDQDDVWHGSKVEEMKNALKSCDLAICDCRVVDENLNPIYDSFFQHNRSRAGFLKNFMKNSFIGCCMAFRRTVLEKSLPFSENIPLHDQWIGLVAERHFNVRFIPQILVDHRRHSKNYSSTGESSENSLGEKIKLRFHLAKELLDR
jgi:glycosyltransferase involved in cell wall biosynthesis